MNTVLMYAHPKVGQHWLMFIVSNYYHVKEGLEPANWEEVMGYTKFDPSDLSINADGISYRSINLSKDIKFARIEYAYDYPIKDYRSSKFIDSFDKRVYIYRNPADVLISMYYYFQTKTEKIQEVNKKKDLKGDIEFEKYAKGKLEIYLDHVKNSIDHADLVLCYDDLLKDPTPFREVLSWIYGDIDEEIFQKTLYYSSFNYVHKLEHEIKKSWAGYTEKALVFHSRNGSSEQYKETMSSELIEYIKQKWIKLCNEKKQIRRFFE